MGWKRFERWRRSVDAWFPERHLYVRSGGEIRTFVLTTGRQLMIAGGVAAVLGWTGVATGAMIFGGVVKTDADQEIVRNQARYERWIADREARLDSAVAQLSNANGAVDALAQTMLKRHAALALVLSDFKGVPGAVEELSPSQLAAAPGAPMDTIRAIRSDEDRLIAQAETYAKTRADRLRLAIRLAGLDPASLERSGAADLGGPLIEAKDPRALAAILDVDEAFARRIQRAALDLNAMKALNRRMETLPLAQPTANTQRASGFGVRLDPFEHGPAFHSGLDFAGPMLTPIAATAPGIVSFTGVRQGYGNTVEIDHGGGFKTRYAHLASIGVQPGQTVGLGQRIAAMGSTGRSTGPHLHYEVWFNGRAQNPDRFLKAGSYVQQAQ
ncbi:MAG: Peptidase [Caulobacteraceae bacterium]|nr:Peptidase [Caulobacteraceae bacterium]